MSIRLSYPQQLDALQTTILALLPIADRVKEARPEILQSLQTALKTIRELQLEYWLKENTGE